MRVGLITKEFPPEVYGGAGVHVEYLSAALAELVDVDVHTFGAPRPSDMVKGTYGHWERLDDSRSGKEQKFRSVLRTLSTDLAIVTGTEGVDVVHSHTWYAQMAGHLSALTHGIPHVLTTHSLEPHRPWKAEQLGGGYKVSSWIEKTAIEAADAVIAVSEGMRADILESYPDADPDRVQVVHNGIDLDEYHPVEATDALTENGVDPDRPYAVFVGRITRQKGVVHLLDALEHLPEDAQVVLAAGAPDTEAIAQEFRDQVATLAEKGRKPIWIEEMLPRPKVVQLLSHASVFVCPSIYEPFGIVNLEAMACGIPVVASSVGGIPEIVIPGETGELVDFAADPDDEYGAPEDPDQFARDLADAMAPYLDDQQMASEHGEAGRTRAVEEFGWDTIAERTVEVYRSVM